MLAMVKRNILLFERNRSGVFFSILGALISFILYLMFLQKSLEGSWSAVSGAQHLLDLWLIGGTLTITGMTTTFASLSQFVMDREKGVSDDLMLGKKSNFKVSSSYIVSAVIIGTAMQVLVAVVMFGYFYLTDGIKVDLTIMGPIFAIMIANAVLSSFLNFIIVSFVKNVDALGRLGTIIGTASGFLVETYIPFGAMPNIAQTIVKIVPNSYVASLYRQVLMKDEMNNTFNVHSQFLAFNKEMGIRFDWGSLLSMHATIYILLLLILGFGLVNGMIWLRTSNR